MEALLTVVSALGTILSLRSSPVDPSAPQVGAPGNIAQDEDVVIVRVVIR